jgi:type IV pilus assembly protein PilE
MASRSPSSDLTSRQSRLRRAGSRGFTLIELMVVVVLVAILASIAMPAMLEAQHSRRAYEDAASIMMLFKNARTRAIGDQAAVTLVVQYDNGAVNRGIISEYESTFSFGSTSNSNTAAGQTTMSACTAPSVWTLPAPATGNHPVLIEGLYMQEQVDIDAHVHLLVNSNPNGPFAFCFSPSGRMYVDGSSTSSSNPTFTEPTLIPAIFTVVRDDGSSSNSYKGLSRNVLVMPSGATRLYSKGGT